MSNTNVPTTINSRQYQDFSVDIYQDDGVTLDTTSPMTASSSTQLAVTGPNSQGVFINATVVAAPSLKKMVVTLGPVVGQ